MDPLSSFAISLAAGIALDIYNKSQGTVKKELKSAFDKALKLWSKNTDIRERKRNQLKISLQKFLSNPEQLINIQDTDSDLNTFLKKYEQALAQYPAAFNYIKEIKDLERFKIEVSFLSSIKDTVEDTNHKLTEIIENNFPKKSYILEEEWKRQLDVYKYSVSKFKPKTALDLLVKLEKSFISNEVKPPNSLLASLEFLKAQCHELIGNLEESYKGFIKAYRLDSSSITFKEKACFAYSKIPNEEEANKLIEKIFIYDEYNPIAWAVKILISKDFNLDFHLKGVPKIVRANRDFRRIFFFNTLTNPKYKDQLILYKKYSIMLEVSDYDDTELTVYNYKDRLFWFECTLTIYTEVLYFNFIKINPGNIELLKEFKLKSSDFLNSLKDSEIIENFNILHFFNCYADFIVENNKEAVFEMKRIYFKIESDKQQLLLMLANSLQFIGEENQAIELIDSQKNKSIESLHLKAYCYIKNQDINNYIKTSKNLILLLNNINNSNLDGIINILNTFYSYGRIKDFDFKTLLSEKGYDDDNHKTFLEEYIRVLTQQNNPDTISKLKSLEKEFLKTKSPLIFYIAYSYFLLQEYNLAIELFDQYISKDIESRDLFYYILSLDEAALNHEQLLNLLQNWRENFSFNEELLRLEGDLRRKLLDWENCILISEYFLDTKPNNESFLTLYLLALNEYDQNNNTKIITDLAYKFESFKFKVYTHAQIVSNILIQNDHHKIALDILYDYAKDVGNKKARMDYFTAMITMPRHLIKENLIVENGWYVKYELNNDILFIKITKDNVLADSLLSHKVNDIVSVQRPMLSNYDSIRILRIMDKYLCLHDEILEEVKSNPYSDIPMQSVEFKDTTLEGMNETFISLFGASGTFEKESKENAFKDYYNYKISFSDIILQNYFSDYLGGYFNLVHQKDGITQIPIIYYPDLSISCDKDFILDISSLLIIHQIIKEHKVNFQVKFIIANGIIDIIKKYLKKEHLSPKEEMSLTITLDGVTPSFKPENASKSNIAFLESLLNWINSNCEIKIVPSKLDLIRKIDDKIKNEMFANYVIDNISLLRESENRLLISDDAIHNKFYPLTLGKTISSELFIKTTIGSSHSANSEFIKNKYIGFTITLETLLGEFNKKVREQPNDYAHCLNNLSLTLNPTRNSIFTIIRFLKEVAMTSLLSEEIFKQEAIKALLILFRGQSDFKPFRITELIIKKEFSLLGNKLDLVLECYVTTLQILRES